MQGLKEPLVVSHWAAVTPLGETITESAFAYRAGLTALRECPILDAAGEKITFASVPTLGEFSVGIERAYALALGAVLQVAAQARTLLEAGGVRVCVLLGEESGVPDAVGIAPAERFRTELRSRLAAQFGASWPLEVDAGGAAALGPLLGKVSAEVAEGRARAVLLVAAHTDYEPARLLQLSSRGRLFSSDHLDGLVPGEAGVALVVTSARSAREFGAPAPLAVVDAFAARDKATIDNDESAFEAGALTVCARRVTGGPIASRSVGWLSTDASFELFRVHELHAVLTRLQRRLTVPQQLDAPNQRIGFLGAAVGVWQIAYVAEAHFRGFAPAPSCLVLLGSEDGQRAALLLEAAEGALPVAAG